MIYADYNSTAPLIPAVKEYLTKRFDTEFFANPNALHTRGREVKEILENARNYCAQFIDAAPSQIYFTSGSTEALNWAIHSLLSYRKRQVVISSDQEHMAVRKLLEVLNITQEITLILIPTKSNGEIDSDQAVSLIQHHREDLAFVTCIAASNETGVIHSLSKIMAICKQENIPFLADTTQLIGKQDFSFKNSNFDMAVISGHKLGALPGSGILISKHREYLSPLILGGQQEGGFRAGTENYIGIETMSIALSEIPAHLALFQDFAVIKENFENKLKQTFPKIVILGENANRIPNTSYISFPQIHSQALQIELESNDIFVTTSSACSDNEPHTSISITAMGLSDKVGRGAIRLSFAPETTQQDLENVYNAIKAAVTKLEKLSI